MICSKWQTQKQLTRTDCATDATPRRSARASGPVCSVAADPVLSGIGACTTVSVSSAKFCSVSTGPKT
jgi:hypothetical protein